MFGKFMNKKFFHPGSYPNIKQKWIHEQRAAAKEKAEQEKKDTYQKEQESYQSRLLSAKSSDDKMKLDLNFMYDLPPGLKNDNPEEEDNEDGSKKEVKFEWQKHAPRSKYINDLGLECQDQPFGVCVRNIRCFKCRQWGHQNTDRECPLFFTDVKTESNESRGETQSLRLSDPLRLVAEMRRQHGITLKKSVIGKEIDPMAENQQLLESDEEERDLGNADLAFIESLSDKQKRKLLKKLNKMEKKAKKRKKKKLENGYNSRSTKRKKRRYSTSSESNSEPDLDLINFKKKKFRRDHENTDLEVKRNNSDKNDFDSRPNISTCDKNMREYENRLANKYNRKSNYSDRTIESDYKDYKDVICDSKERYRESKIETRRTSRAPEDRKSAIASQIAECRKYSNKLKDR